MGDIDVQYRNLDALGLLATAQDVTADAYQDETRLDFKRALGCGHIAIVVKVNSITTAKTIDVAIFESSDDSSYAEITNKLRLVAVGAGTYLLLINNKIVTKQYAKLKFIVNSFATGSTANVDAYCVPISGLV